MYSFAQQMFIGYFYVGVILWATGYSLNLKKADRILTCTKSESHGKTNGNQKMIQTGEDCRCGHHGSFEWKACTAIVYEAWGLELLREGGTASLGSETETWKYLYKDPALWMAFDENAHEDVF